MHINAPEVDVQRANLPTISVGHLAVGPIGVGELVLSNTNLSLSTGEALLRNVNVDLSLTIAIEWSVGATIDLGFFGTYHFGDSGTIDVGTIGFSLPFPIPQLIIPTLKSIDLNIPSLTAKTVSVTASPLTDLKLANAHADTVRATNVKLPSAGFGLNGLSLTSVQGTALSVPAAAVDQAAVGHFTGDPVSVVQLSLSSLNLPDVSIPTINSTSPFDVPITLGKQRIPVVDTGGVLSLTLDLTPSVTSHIQSLSITSATAKASADAITIRNITLPYDALNLTLSSLGIDTIQVPQFSIT